MAIQHEVKPAESDHKPQFMHVKVVDHSSQPRPAVNVKMPISVVKWGMKMAQAFSPEMKETKVDWDAVAAMIESGEIGKIVEVEDEGQQKTVEVWVE
jgi:hypothetical protein